ncbi:hypothetical protein HUJ04_011132, partial [Dendroctonus ponderosae]
MNGVNEKRQRSQNFCNDEKISLMDIIEKYKNIVENKKTDCISSNQKKKAWVQIANEFNAICPDSSFRDCNTLKKFYENKKKEVRKYVLHEKKHINATGGGPAFNMKKDICFDYILNMVNHKTVAGSFRDCNTLKKFYENKKKEVRKYVLHEKKHINATGGGPAFNMKKDICFDYILNMVNHKTVAGLENKFSNLTDPPFGDNSSQADNPEENPFADNATGDYPPITLEELEADYQLQDVQLLETEQSEVSNNLYSSTWTNMTPNKLKACPTSVLKKKCATNEKEIFNLNRKTPARRSAASTSNRELMLMVRELRESITALRNDMQSLKMRENGRKANMTDNKRPSMKIDARTTKVAPTDSKKTTLPEKSNKRKFEDDSAEVPVPKKAGLETVIESETDMEVENPNKPSNYADAARKIPPVNVKGHEKWTQMVAHLENEGINLEKSAMTKEGYR